MEKNFKILTCYLKKDYFTVAATISIAQYMRRVKAKGVSLSLIVSECYQLKVESSLGIR